MNRAQDASDHAGAIVRMREDGGAPGQARFGDGDPHVHAIGLRNVQGMASPRTRATSSRNGAATSGMAA